MRKFDWRIGLVKWRVQEKNKEKERAKIENQIAKNFEIIRRSNGKRRDAAIYRLYRYCNFSPYEIHYETGIPESRIKYIVGKVFRKLCLKDEKCIFKEMLKA